MNFIFLYFSLIKLTESLNSRNVNRNKSNFRHVSSDFKVQKKINLNKFNYQQLSSESTKKNSKFEMIPKNDNSKNSTSTDNQNNNDNEKKESNLFQRVLKAISTLIIILLVLFIIFIIIYIIIVKSGIKTNFDFTRQLNKLGILGRNDNEDTSNELDIKAILGEVKTSDSESMPMDENEDINDENDENNQNNQNNDAESNKNNEIIDEINESS